MKTANFNKNNYGLLRPSFKITNPKVLMLGYMNQKLERPSLPERSLFLAEASKDLDQRRESGNFLKLVPSR